MHLKITKARSIELATSLRLSKKSSFCWAFSIFYDIIHMGDENA